VVGGGRVVWHTCGVMSLGHPVAVWGLVGGVLMATAGAAVAQTTVVYDPAAGGRPSAQGRVLLINPEDAGVESDAVPPLAPGVVLDTTGGGQAGAAGYFSHIGLPPVFPVRPVIATWPVLDRVAGFALRAEVELLAEQHTGEERAGLSVIVLSSDRRGVEIGLWEGAVWMQNGGTAPTLFTRGETWAMPVVNTTLRLKVVVKGEGVVVLANGRPVLGGAVRDYTAFVPSGLPFNPYTTPNFVFIGDNTSRGAARFRLGRVEVVRPAPAVCWADVTGVGGPPAVPDGLLTGDDFVAFIGAFAAGEPLADITGVGGAVGGTPVGPDGVLTGDDFLAFVNAFAAGCEGQVFMRMDRVGRRGVGRGLGWWLK